MEGRPLLMVAWSIEYSGTSTQAAVSRVSGSQAFGQERVDHLARELIGLVAEHALDVRVGPQDPAAPLDHQQPDR